MPCTWSYYYIGKHLYETYKENLKDNFYAPWIEGYASNEFRECAQEWIDYIDDISRNVLYLKIHDVLIICALDSFNFFNLQYQEEVHILDSLEIVHPLQGLELFAKMVYYKTHYKFDTEHKVIIDASGPYIENKIINATQIRPFNLKELYDLMKNVLQLRGVTDEIPEYVEGKMFSFIPRKV